MTESIEKETEDRFNLERFIDVQDFWWGHAFQDLQDDNSRI